MYARSDFYRRGRAWSCVLFRGTSLCIACQVGRCKLLEISGGCFSPRCPRCNATKKWMPLSQRMIVSPRGGKGGPSYMYYELWAHSKEAQLVGEVGMRSQAMDVEINAPCEQKAYARSNGLQQFTTSSASCGSSPLIYVGVTFLLCVNDLGQTMTRDWSGVLTFSTFTNITST
jgi:hypothetical protein